MGVHFLNDFQKMNNNRAMEMLSFDVKCDPSGIWCIKKKFQNNFLAYFTHFHNLWGLTIEKFDFVEKVACQCINSEKSVFFSLFASQRTP